MPYCTRTDLVERFGSDVVADLEYDRPDAVDQAIADTDALIDGYIGSRYPVPMVVVPTVVSRIARDLVRYELDINPDDVISKRRDEAIKMLNAISKGELSLGVAADDEPDGFDTAEIENDGHVFRRSDSKEFI